MPNRQRGNSARSGRGSRPSVTAAARVAFATFDDPRYFFSLPSQFRTTIIDGPDDWALSRDSTRAHCGRTISTAAPH